MLELTAVVKFKIPKHDGCNLKSGKLCRFCTPGGVNFRCSLHDEPLHALSGIVYKCEGCLNSMVTARNVIEDPAEGIEPRAIMRYTVNEYSRVYRALRRSKYSEGMALELAKEQVLRPDPML